MSSFRPLGVYFGWHVHPWEELEALVGRAESLGYACAWIDGDATLHPGLETLDGWTVTKRAVTELPADGEIYRQAVIDWLAGEGIASPEIGTLRIFRVDLEGDGTDEVFLNATHLDDSQHTTRLGDYSLILMRKVVGNDGTNYRGATEEVLFRFLGHINHLRQPGNHSPRGNLH